MGSAMTQGILYRLWSLCLQVLEVHLGGVVELIPSKCVSDSCRGLEIDSIQELRVL
jgi:hypothetical protein